MDNNTETQIIQALGIKNLRHWESISFGGGAGNATVGHAAAAVSAGYCKYAVCFRAANLRSDLRLGRSRDPQLIPGGARSFHAPWGSLAPAHHFGMFVRRYMHQYGATSRHFGWVAVTLRYHASRNPRALRQTPITIKDHQESRLIADPLRLLDFCQENDGAAAIVISTVDRARDLRHGDTIVLIEAAAQGSGPSVEGIIYRPDLAIAESSHTAHDIWMRARLTARDIDAFMFYDHFTPFCLIGLEAYGFVPVGEAKDFVEGGHNLRYDGVLPTNTHGGNHSEAYIHGLTHPQEGVRLIRGTSTSQPPNKSINRVLSCSTTAQLSAAVILKKG
ncbi:lipid-transfer protein [SAR202 cluster bacterium AD-804-J14_MRT_500m]|nr:lipid-transfer protein [SAR202 cluster bacterium AD-804-J14_MRT_500m]